MSKNEWLQDGLPAQAKHLLQLCQTKGLTIATAESCTGGLVAAALTEVADASKMFDRGFITYTNKAKTDMLGIAIGLIEAHGAVSKFVAIEMARGALERSTATLAIGITGIAGPGGATSEKPIGLVHFAAQIRNREPVHVEERFGNLSRKDVRHKAVLRALAILRELAEGYEPLRAS